MRRLAKIIHTSSSSAWRNQRSSDSTEASSSMMSLSASSFFGQAHVALPSANEVPGGLVSDELPRAPCPLWCRPFPGHVVSVGRVSVRVVTNTVFGYPTSLRIDLPGDRRDRSQRDRFPVLLQELDRVLGEFGRPLAFTLIDRNEGRRWAVQRRHRRSSVGMNEASRCSSRRYCSIRSQRMLERAEHEWMPRPAYRVAAG